MAFPGGTSSKETACQCRRQEKRTRSLVRKIPCRRRAWQTTSVFLPGESHGQRSLADYSPLQLQGVGNNWSDLTHKHTQHKAYISYLGVQIETDEYSRYQAILQISRPIKASKQSDQRKKLEIFPGFYCQGLWKLLKLTEREMRKTRKREKHCSVQSLSHVQLFATPWTATH